MAERYGRPDHQDIDPGIEADMTEVMMSLEGLTWRPCRAGGASLIRDVLLFWVAISQY
ncbi:hypothetical protein ABZ297_12655 [Nonomuraea sp. NPDC005983]|uniref:hypothetical protein n=1 Tax=Nonomuraea sp. NPDC005983 TaxID=3155595 RepID=UPI0033A0F8FE